MKKRKIPLRQCIGCMESKPKKELIRIVKTKDGEMKVDKIGKVAGRGAYICNNIECFKIAHKKRALNRAFQQDVSQDVYNKLHEELEENEK